MPKTECWLDKMAPPKDRFFERLGRLGKALTFDDVRIVTDHADFAPPETDLKSRFSRRVPLNFPLVGAAMDTVTQDPMAIVFAEFGGIGVIHKNLSIADQAAKVRRVRRHRQSRVETPVTVRDTDTFGKVRQMIADMELPFLSFPVEDVSGQIVGLITAKHFELAPSDETLVRDQMVPRVRMLVGPPNMEPAQALATMRERGKKVIPLLDLENRLRGMYVASSLTPPARFNTDSLGRLRVAAAIGTSATAFQRALALLEADVSAIVIDTAHGD